MPLNCGEWQSQVQRGCNGVANEAANGSVISRHLQLFQMGLWDRPTGPSSSSRCEKRLRLTFGERKPALPPDSRTPRPAPRRSWWSQRRPRWSRPPHPRKWLPLTADLEASKGPKCHRAASAARLLPAAAARCPSGTCQACRRPTRTSSSRPGSRVGRAPPAKHTRTSTHGQLLEREMHGRWADFMATAVDLMAGRPDVPALGLRFRHSSVRHTSSTSSSAFPASRKALSCST